MARPAPVKTAYLRARFGRTRLRRRSTVAAEPLTSEPVDIPLVNRGFEQWAELDPSVAKQDGTKNVDLEPPGWGPVGWVPRRELTKDQQRTGAVARDAEVKHSGDYAVRIHNGDMRDISLVAYSTEGFTKQLDDQHNIQPNRRYLLRWWVKGEPVDAKGTGPLLMMYVMSHHDVGWYRANTYEQGVEPPKGSFDWQERRFVFITDEHAKWFNVTLQLRWTTGTIWYDDVSLTELGPVVPVETY